MEELVGTVDHVVYADSNSGFTVAHLKKSGLEKTCIVGVFPSLHPGEVVHCQGSWKHHPAHGRQFAVEKYSIKVPHDADAIRKYLESGLIKGIGPKYAERIVEHFGDETLNVIDNQVDRLIEVEGVGKKRIEQIRECWQEQKSLRNVMIFLRSHGISAALAQKIYKRYGDESIEVLEANPYTIAREIFGIGFKTADQIAQSLGLSLDHPQRINCGIEHLLYALADEGHVCYPKERFLPYAAEQFGVDLGAVETGVVALREEGRVVSQLIENEERIWLKPFYMAELGAAKELNRIRSEPSMLREIQMDRAIEWVQEKLHLELATAQKLAIQKSCTEKVHIITGGPGTGKSTITKAILAISEKLTDQIKLAAPTGKAAKRLSEITRKRASTIHALLEVDFNTKGFKRNGKNPIECDLLIIDEASMIDALLINHLLKAIPSHARVIFIGDIDQLPSVGPGNVLKDLIRSDRVPVTMLTEIFRQAKSSRIVTNAHRINQGDFPDLTFREKSDFHFVEAEKPEEILKEIVDLNRERLPNVLKFNPIEEIQVLAPMKRGVIGTENLNFQLQRALNPGKTGIERMGRFFSLGDKVMQIRNNYSKYVFNGDVGFIESLDREEQMLVVSFDGKPVEYDFTELDELTLSYAVSIHKYQGSECKCIIIPIHTSHFKLLYRNLLYTGITRGKKMVVLVGSKRAIALAVKNDEIKQRYTALSTLLQ